MFIINPIFEARLKFLVYRFRFLALYLFFGVLSLLLEFLIRNILISNGLDMILSSIFAVFFGILFAFWTNYKFNFKIPPSSIKQALSYFIIISCFSGIIQWSFIKILSLNTFNYEMDRLIISGTLFMIAYFFHRKFSFRDYKKVGVAIYANGIENLQAIYDKISYFPDFIHVDIVDDSMSENAEEVATYRLETMKAYWPKTQIQTHIMSMFPSKWIGNALLYSDVVYIHAECKENISILIKNIKSSGKKAGIALTMDTNPLDVPELNKVDYVLLLTIRNPGYSGQKFDIEGIEKINQINNLSFRTQFVLCVDGGVNEQNISSLQAENVVSGSSVLNSSNPKGKILRLQTVGRYEV